MQLERQLMGDESLEPEVSFALLEMLRVRSRSALVQLLSLEMHMTQLARLSACSAAAQRLAVLLLYQALSAGSLPTCSACQLSRAV